MNLDSCKTQLTTIGIFRSIFMGLALTLPLSAVADPAPVHVDYGPRPAYLIDQLDPGPLRDKLTSCLGQKPSQSTFSIAHRGAPLMFPEHSVQSNKAAARMGAGVLECDVTFTADHELVCRHSQNDLHRTTDILLTDQADSCVTPFTPATGGTPAQAECRTSDLTLAEFLTLTPKMDSADPSAQTAADYQGGLAPFRTQLYTPDAQILTHTDSIRLFRQLGAKFTPELKTPVVPMPHNGFSQTDFAQKLIDAYKTADIPAADVFPQSFDLNDVLYWIDKEPEFGAQAIYLVAWPRGFDEQRADTWPHDFDALKAQGVNILGASLNMLLTNDNGQMAASAFAKSARAAGLDLIAWTLERSGPLSEGGGWYYRSVTDLITNDGDIYVALDVLAQDAGVRGVFSDWPATVTYYANCMGLK